MLQNYINARIGTSAANKNSLIPQCFKNENVKLSLGMRREQQKTQIIKPQNLIKPFPYNNRQT